MPALNFSVLGPLRIEHQQFGAITLSNRKVMALLVYLLVESDRAHSREFLLGLLWPDLPTAAAQNNLRVTWAQLQKTLGASNSDEQPFLIADRLSLRFNPHSDHQLDLARFRRLLDACRRHPHSDPHSCAECAARLTEALALLHGDFLPSDFLDGFSLDNCLQFDEWLLMQRQQLHVQVTSALEQLAAFHETSGQLAEAERTIRRLLEYDPLNESAYRQLMRVLAGSDQRSAALDLYEKCRHLLASELGLPPAVETVMLAEQIRTSAAVEPPSAQVVLPPVLTRFFGRQQESARLVDLLSQQKIRLVTVTGPGGVGKTRLAIDVAHRLTSVFANEVCFVELAGIVDDSAVEDALAAALHLPTSTGRSSTSAIVEYLRGRKLLLILDNCEHLVKTCATLVQTLCRAAAALTVLATSRIPLHLAEEQVVRLEPFAAPVLNSGQRLTVADSLRFDSVQLFTDRATHSLLHFALTNNNVLAVARICQQLDGIPLAIEIAAAQARALPIEAIAERLSQRFAWLNRQAGETLSRQRTLHTLIDWSYGLLSQPARALLRRLSVFAGGWTLEAAEALCAAGEVAGEATRGNCAELLADLVDHSLVVFGADSERRRYTVHETIRQFAQEHLRGSGQEEVVQELHARYYAQLVAQAAGNRSTQPMVERLRTIQDDHDNLRAAFEWLVAHDSEQALTVVAQLGTELDFWELGGFFQEGRRWLQRALERTEGSISIARAKALLAASDLSSAICDFDYGLQAIRSAQAIFQQLGDQQGDIDARLDYCYLAELAGETIDLQKHVEEALQLAEQISYAPGIARGKRFLGTHIFYANGDSEKAIHYLLPSVAIWREQQHPFHLASALTWLGVFLFETGQYAASREAHEESRILYQSLGYRRGVALALHNLGEISIHMGENVKAREMLCESLRIRRQLGLPRGYTYSFEGLAQLNENEEQSERAVQLWAAADSLRKHLGAPLEQAAQKHVIASLTRLRARLGDRAFELEWSKGATMTTEQAIQLALS